MPWRDGNIVEAGASKQIAPGRLYLARAIWLLVACTAVTLTCAGVPAQYDTLSHQCTNLAQLLPLPFCLGYYLAWEIVLALVFFVSGIMVFRARSDTAMPLLLSLLLIIGGATEPGMTDALVFGDSPHALPWLSWPVLILRASGVAGMLICFYVFPDSRFVPRPTRWLALGWLILNIAWLFNPMLPGNAIYGPGWRAWLLVSLVHFGLWVGTGIIAVIYRYRRTANSVQRQQIKWGGFGLTLATLGQLYYYAHDFSLFGFPNRLNLYDALAIPFVRTALSICGPLCLGIAVMHYRLWDIDRLINRAVVYTLLTCGGIGFYSVLVTSLNLLLPQGAPPFAALIASGFVAVLFQPLYRWLQQALNRRMYGHRDEPAAALNQLALRLEATLHSEAILPAIAETIGRGFRIPFVRIEVLAAGGTTIAAGNYGSPEPPVLTMPLIYQRETIGYIALGPRAPGELFSNADKRSLGELTARASIAAYTVRVNLELGQSRERLRNALEEGRRRMRQNLHDGLGPALASQQFILATVDRLLLHDPAAAAVLLGELREQSRTMVEDVRRMVEDLRPPALDDLGLVGAVRERIAAYSHAPLAISFQAPERMPTLPAAVEVAAYYLVMESITNVVRHAAATTCHVALRFNGGLQVSVVDDGIGLPETYTPGIGIRSMRERVVELGGTWRITALPHGGTKISAVLPVVMNDDYRNDE